MNFALRIPDYYRKDIELLKGDISYNQVLINEKAPLARKNCLTTSKSPFPVPFRNQEGGQN